MKTLHLSIIVISLMILASCNHIIFAQQTSYPNSPTLPEGSSPPVIITQVELASPFALFPDNQTCYNKPGFASAYTCTTDIIPNHKVQCEYFIGSGTCGPIHQYTHGTDKNCLGTEGIGISNAPQWFDVYNTQNKTIQLQYFDVKIPSTSGSGYSEDGPHYTIPVIGPYEKCTFFFFPVNEPISLDPTNRTILISYDYEGKHYVSSTPQLTDLDNDGRTWQFDGNRWIFAEQNTMPQRKEIPLNQNSTALAMAIKLATSSPQFQSLVRGYNYTFSSDFEESGPLSQGGIGLTAHGFTFELYQGPVEPGKAVKVVEVLEDPALAKILDVTSSQAEYNGPLMSSATPTNPPALHGQNNTVLSPLKQFKSGTAAKNVICVDGLTPVLKSEDGSPACVKQDTAKILIERGWARPL